MQGNRVKRHLLFKHSSEHAMDTNSWLLVSLMILLLLSLWSTSSSDNLQRLRRIERKVDLILSHLGIDPSQGVSQQVMEHMKAGQKIQAIKAYREQTGAGLKEAKDHVEGL
jgi:hypothetical protein